MNSPIAFPTPRAEDWKGWRWPVLPWGDRLPVVSHEFEAGERFLPNGHLNYAVHLGLDIMFQWRVGDPRVPADTVAMKRNGMSGFIAPQGSIVVAAFPGTVWQAGPSPLGLHVQLDHGDLGPVLGGVNTYYQHMVSFARDWKRGDEVRAGDVLGVMGGDPANVPHLRHLHFELWFPRKGVSSAYWPTDPAPYMAHWYNGPIVGVV
jgi:hypothetical protein